MPGRHRPPHPARPGEVLARAGVVDAAVGGRARCSTRSGAPARGCRSGCRAARRWPGRPAPASSRGTPPCRRCVRAGSASSAAIASPHRAAGHDLVGDRAHLGLEPGQLVEAPGVRLVQVDRGAEEVARRQLVALAADGLLVPAERGQLLAQEPGEVGGGLAGRRRPPAPGRPRARRAPRRRWPTRRGEPGPEVVAVRVDPDVALLGHLEHLAAGPTTCPCAAASSRVRREPGPARSAPRPAGRRCWPPPARRRSASGRRPTARRAARWRSR